MLNGPYFDAINFVGVLAPNRFSNLFLLAFFKSMINHHLDKYMLMPEENLTEYKRIFLILKPTGYR